MGAAVVWLGPVSLAQVPGARLPGVPTASVPCTGDGKPTCGQIVDALAGEGGTKVPGLLKKLGVAPGSELVLGAFSAGGSAVKRLMMEAPDRASIRAVLLSDAMFEGVPLTGNQVPPFSEGFVRFALDAIEGDQLFLATSSSAPNACQGGKAFCGTGIQVMQANMAEIEKRSGLKFKKDTETFAQVSPQPAIAWRLGNVRFGEFPTVGHGEHVTKLADQVWKTVLQPWWEGGGPPPGPGPVEPPPVPAPPAVDEPKGGATRLLMAFLVGVGLGFGAMRMASRKT